jgi:hypothetical protein
MPTEFDVIQNGHTFEEFYILKGASNAQFGNGVGWYGKDIFTLVKDLTFLGGIKAADAIKQAGFAGPVGSDNGKNFTTEKPGIDIIKRLNAAEGQRHIVNFYDSVITHSVPLSAWVSINCCLLKA